MCYEHTGRPIVAINGTKVSGWTFDANNVLAFEHQAGYSAWLQVILIIPHRAPCACLMLSTHLRTCTSLSLLRSLSTIFTVVLLTVLYQLPTCHGIVMLYYSSFCICLNV